EQSNNEAALNSCIELEQASLDLCPQGYPDRHTALANLTISLWTRYKLLGSSQADLNLAIDMQKQVLDLCPQGHPDRHTALANLASSLWTRYNLLGSQADLNLAIDMEKQVLDLRPQGHPDRHTALANLADSLQTRYKLLGSQTDLNLAIQLFQQALAMLHPMHPSYPWVATLQNVVTSWIQHAEQFQHPSILDAYQISLTVLDYQITTHSSLSLRHGTMQSKITSLANNAFSSALRQNKTEQAVELLEQGRALLWTQLARLESPLAGLESQSEGGHDLARDQADLNLAIDMQKQVLDLCPQGHPHRHTALASLASSLQTRYNLLGSQVDLNLAIDMDKQVLDLCPQGHPDRHGALANLATSLWTRYNLLGSQADLNLAIDMDKQVLDLRPQGHPHRHSALANLATSLWTRYNLLGSQADLNLAIDMEKQVLDLRPPGHPDRHTALGNLADSLRTQYNLLGSQIDLNLAIQHSQQALAMLHPMHPSYPSVAGLLASIILKHPLQSSETLPSSIPDSGEAFRIYSTLQESILHPSADLQDAVASWIQHAEQFQHPSILDAYQTSLTVLDYQITTHPSLSLRHGTMQSKITSLANNAFSSALRQNKAEHAVELLEQGRALLWTQLARLESPLAGLESQSERGHDLAREFNDLSAKMQSFTNHSHGQGESSDTTQYFKTLHSWEEAVRKIRLEPGFSRFLLPPLFTELREAACNGPVIIVNASKHGCDALIVLHSQSPLRVPGVEVNLEDINRLSSKFVRLIEESTFAARETRNAHDVNRRYLIIEVLRELWEKIVHPVVQVLQETLKLPFGKRIWWCPTAQFTTLPFHAAGPYLPRQKNLMGFYCSSYTPSLSALNRARSRLSSDGVSSSALNLALVGQSLPDASQGQELRSVDKELNMIAHMVPASIAFDKITGPCATRAAVVDAFRAHRWVHLACHGAQALKNPFDSSFAMKDGPLTLLDILQHKFVNSDLAFLSACHTAVGDRLTPDEVIHLAAGMQFAGFKSVIGTMWKVSDELAQHIVKRFYEQMFKVKQPSYKYAAVCLNNAVIEVGKAELVPLEQRIVFMHIGI
ncbi:hypothetical protein HYDPIDRAFT_92330, partial [Hydnomerulius pinastri MD-312]